MIIGRPALGEDFYASSSSFAVFIPAGRREDDGDGGVDSNNSDVDADAKGPLAGLPSARALPNPTSLYVRWITPPARPTDREELSLSVSIDRPLAARDTQKDLPDAA